MRGRRLAPFLLLLPFLLLMGIFLLGLASGLVQSFGVVPSLGLTEPTLDYYRGLLGSSGFWQSLCYSLYLSVVSSVLAVALGVALCSALVLSGRVRGRASRLIRLPIMLPHVVVALFVMNLLSQSGLIARLLYALGLIEHFYRAGFDHMTVVSAVGRLLSLRSKEEFNAVDIAVIDTVTGSAEFIKVGGRESFIVRKGLVDVVESDSLPIGILEEVEAVTERRRLFPNTFIVMVSDGVIDVLGREKLIELLGNVRSGNPDEVAATVMEATVREAGKERDDASVLVGKIFIPR